MKKVQLVAIGVWLVSMAGHAEVLLSEDFETGQTVGSKPTGATIVRPSTSSADIFTHVVDSGANTAGTGNGVQLHDNGVAEGTMLTYNFVANSALQLSAVRVDFSFAALGAAGAGDDYIAIAFGEYSASKTLNGSARRLTDMRLYNDGTVDFRTATGTAYSSNNDVSTGSHTISIFANDALSPLDYTGLDAATHTLAANSVAYWLDGSLVVMNGGQEYIDMDLGDATAGGTVGSSADNLGKFGFNTGSSDVGLSYMIDDIEITSIDSGGDAPDTGIVELVAVDFEGQTIGAKPVGATTVRPSTSTATGFTHVTGSATNTAGTGNGIHFYDNNAADGNMLTYNFVGGSAQQLSAVRVDFSFAALSSAGAGDDYIAVAFGEYSASKTLNASARRFTDARLYNDGTIDFRNIDLAKPYSLNNALLAGANTLSIFVNDNDSAPLAYTGIDSNSYELAANSVAYWLNGSLVTMNGGEEYTALDLDDATAGGTVGTTEYNFGKFGFNTGSSDVGLDYVIDDIKIYEIVSDGALDLSVHNLFQNHMVLQRDLDTPIWGTASTGVTVQVFLDDVLVGSGIADTNGDWMVRMAPHATDGGVQHALKVLVEGAREIILNDVIFGDVYLASGQSNMAFAMANIVGYSAIEASLTNQNIRQVNVDRAAWPTELYEPTYKYNWEVSAPDTVRHFTAVGYLFAQNVYEQTGIPIGLLHSSYGGQKINRFLNPEGMAMVPELTGMLADHEAGGVVNLYDIYNAMIGPVVPYGICGFLWYQGESDRSVAGMYEQKMLALMRGWRAVWDLGDLPFYYWQLPNYDTTDYPAIRDAQLRALSETNTGMAVIIDVGDDGNIHPTNKQDPGYRLAQWALANQFGQTGVYSGPLYLDTLPEGTQVRVLFDYAEGGLMVGQKNGTNQVVEVPGGTLENFEVAGADRVFVAATAMIDADTVVVSAPSVASAQFVRYCHSSAPTGLNKLYNRAGFPAAAFRTDESFELKVVSGTGSAESVVPGTGIAISADAPPAGQVFDRWIGAAGLGDASATVTMPAHDLYLVASYRDSGAPTYSLTVNSGIGDGTAQADTLLNIEADAAPTGQVFDGWVGDTQSVMDISAPSTTLGMPGSNVVVTATYRAEDPPVVPASALGDLEVSATEVSLLFFGDAGFRYQLDSTTNLLATAWQPALYNIKGDGFEKQLWVPSQGEPEAFYRVQVR